MGEIKDLFIKQEKKGDMVSKDTVVLKDGYGIIGDINANALSPRQVLIVESETLEALRISPGSLRENISVKGIDLNNLPSGTVLQVGSEVKLRITFTAKFVVIFKA